MIESAGVTYQACLPLRWHVCAVTPLDIERARVDNLSLLQSLATLESPTDLENGADPVVAKALERLEARVDVMMTMLSKLVAQYVDMPPKVNLKLGARHLEWELQEALPGVGAQVLLMVYLSPRLASPLRLFARVISEQPDRCVAEFLDHDEEHEDWITRTLFRYHRRVLQARHQSQA